MTRWVAGLLALFLFLLPAVADACKAPGTRVLFEPGTARIVGDQGSPLKDFILYALSPETTEIQLVAMASERGDSLARARAEAVIERLTAMGISRDRITVETRSTDARGPDTGRGVDLMRLPYPRCMPDDPP